MKQTKKALKAKKAGAGKSKVGTAPIVAVVRKIKSNQGKTWL